LHTLASWPTQTGGYSWPTLSTGASCNSPTLQLKLQLKLELKPQASETEPSQSLWQINFLAEGLLCLLAHFLPPLLRPSSLFAFLSRRAKTWAKDWGQCERLGTFCLEFVRPIVFFCPGRKAALLNMRPAHSPPTANSQQPAATREPPPLLAPRGLAPLFACPLAPDLSSRLSSLHGTARGPVCLASNLLTCEKIEIKTPPPSRPFRQPSAHFLAARPLLCLDSAPIQREIEQKELAGRNNENSPVFLPLCSPTSCAHCR